MNIMNVTLHKPSIKLAGLYLGILLTISLFFSASVYRLSMDQFDKGFKTGPGVVMDMRAAGPNSLMTDLKTQLMSERDRLRQDAQQRVLGTLVLTNIVIVIAGGFLSYYLARRTLQPIEEAHEAQSRFTADASHELRTPLAAMQSETEVALMDPKLTLAQAKERLQSNLEELAKITTLSEGLLRLAQLDNTDTAYRQPVTLATVVQQATTQLLPAAEAKGMLIRAEIPDHLTVGGDEPSLREVCVILLDNAVKYSPDKTEVVVRTRESPKHIVLTVQDQGVGIKATELPHIFERFYRADSARSKQQTQGYGLGLAIAKDIVGAHGGTLSAQSQPGKGSTFTVQLPRA
jgi:signal transduction histidine kinase